MGAGGERLKDKVNGRTDATPQQRAILAEFCRTLRQPSARAAPAAAPSHPSPVQGISQSMSPRTRQTLELLLAGDSEKQIAGKLGLSPHTVHDYVKAVYRRFDVCSRPELLALWIRR